MKRTMCIHCHKRLITRPRQLCRGCYYSPGLRERYPPKIVNTDSRGSGIANKRTLPLPPEPTQTRPGSEERILVLQDRAAKGFQLWHPDDVVIDLS